ncbi:MAG: hypothetical protein HY321_14615 [Armatimonadetes bacterium]|nr:hypothetical protein [Armatimonadota bacterium]
MFAPTRELAKARYFDYEKVAKEAGISPDQLAALRELVRREFPRDDKVFGRTTIYV